MACGIVKRQARNRGIDAGFKLNPCPRVMIFQINKTKSNASFDQRREA
jgi:hypothetical protein